METVTQSERQTPLYDEHTRAGARMSPFAGFSMPIQYRGIIEEHRAVRSAVGLFDLSHMGEFRIDGPGAVDAIDNLVTNDIRGLGDWQIRYTPMCLPSGGIIDDLLVYRFPDHLLLVVNASNIEKDLDWVRNGVGPDVTVTNRSDETALIAIQGPLAQTVLQRETAISLSTIAYYHFQLGAVCGRDAIVSRTGYTGEDGFELYLSPLDAPHVWQRLMESGADEGIQPIGLGARDTLRLEAGYMLYGNDIDASTTPLEAGLSWTVKFGDHDFIGRQALERQRAEGVPRRMIMVQAIERAIPRPHVAIVQDDVTIGEITSGTFSPTFGAGIGLGYIKSGHAKRGDVVGLDIRGRQHSATIVRKPMYRREEG